MKCCVIVCVLVFLTDSSWSKVLPSESFNDLNYNSLLPVGKIFSSCSDSRSLKICLKMRSLMFLDDLTTKDSPIHLLGNSLTLVKSSEARTARMLPESVEELDSTLPKDEVKKEETLDKLISTSLDKFVTSRALQIKLPDLSIFSVWSSLEEARRKKGGGLGAGWAFMSAGGMLGALGLGAIALLAGKALTVSMMALLLAALSAMRKGGGGGGGGHSSYEVISVPTGHGHHGRRLGVATSRSLATGVELPEDPELQGAELAYRAYMQNNTQPYEKKNI